MPAPYDVNRDDITDALMGQNKGGALGYGLSGLASGTAGMQTQMPAGMLAGMPQTPAGGVPGSGVAPMQPMQQQAMPMQPRTQTMGTMQELSQIPWQGGGGGMPQGQPQTMPLAMPQQRRRTY